MHIALHKQIPTGGGLGGGSSNAATTLLALNKLWQLALDQPRLQAIGASLGADVPVFVGGRTAWAEGIGELLDACGPAGALVCDYYPVLPRLHRPNIFPLTIDTQHLSDQNGDLF